jgi:enoyl-CoA hydratase
MSEIVLDDGGMNLLSSTMLRWIRAQLPPSEATMLVLRSGRPHIFAAGADMAEMRAFGARDAEEFARLGQELFETIEKLPMITVALIDGDCFGGALDLVLAFDLRFATPRSRFAHPGGKLGIVTGFGGTSRWRKAIDRAAARRLFLGNERLTAQEALEAGLVDRVGEPFDGELRRLQSLDRTTVRLLKELSRHADALSQRELMLLAERLGALYR